LDVLAGAQKFPALQSQYHHSFKTTSVLKIFRQNRMGCRYLRQGGKKNNRKHLLPALKASVRVSICINIGVPLVPKFATRFKKYFMRARCQVGKPPA
jgi:hypothetical protein